MAKRITEDCFIKKLIGIYHDKYDYSEVHYLGSTQKVKVICKKHGAFMALPNNLIRGHGCPICSKEKAKVKLSLGRDGFIKKSNMSTHEQKCVSFVQSMEIFGNFRTST